MLELQLQDRLNKIQQVKINRDRKEAEEELNNTNKRTKLINEIKELSPRIKALITLANTCKANNIPLSRSYYIHGYDKAEYFFTDGFYHYLGFYDETPITYIGIMNGGACGKYDLRVNAEGTIFVTEHGYNNYNIASIDKISTSDLESFVKNFPKFEERFLNWIDNLQ